MLTVTMFRNWGEALTRIHPITLLALERSPTSVIREFLLHIVLYMGHFKKCKGLFEARLDANMFHDHEASSASSGLI